MKVQVYSKFSKNKICKKMKSPSSMRNGRFHSPKCRGRASFKKWGCYTPILSKCHAIPKLPHNSKKKIKNFKKF
jgi:hypothetical protein